MQYLYGTRKFKEETVAYRQLTEIERYQIEELKRDEFAQSDIAKSFSISLSTVNRELTGNSDCEVHTFWRGYLIGRWCLEILQREGHLSCV